MRWRALRLTAVALAVCAGVAVAQDAPPKEPMLRVATAQHTATIHAVTATTTGDVIATAGDDKTIRLWRAKDGAPLNVIRIPIAPGEDGLLYSLAFAPSGKFILAGGVSGRQWGSRNFVYVIRVATGEIALRIPVSGVVRRIAYGAQAGEPRIGIALSAKTGGGIEIRDRRTKVLFSDIDLEGRPTWLDFTPSGDLIVAMEGGVLAVYDGETFEKRTHRLVGKTPAVARSSPDGALVAVGYFDRRAVDVLDLATFETVTSLSGGFVSGAPHLNALTWGGNGALRDLWTAGAYTNNQGETIIRRWPDVLVDDQFTDIPVASDALTMLETMTNGSVIFASSDPSWGVVDDDMRIRHRGDREGGDFRLLFERLFAVSPNGDRLAFNFSKSGNIGDLVYDKGKGVVQALTTEQREAVLSTWRTPEPPEALKDWRLGNQPTFEGRSIRLGLAERSLSADAFGDGFIIGGDRGVYVFDGKGAPVAKRRLATSAFGVLAVDATRFVAALGDGTLRWFRVTADGIEEAGAFFYARSSERWLAWLPDGRFDHSSNGGQELAGFHVNRSEKEAAEWIEFSQLYRSRYAPEQVRAAMLGRDIPPLAAEKETLATPDVVLTAFCPIIDGDVGDCFDANLALRGFGAIGDQAADESGVGARALPAVAEAVLLKFDVTKDAGDLSKIDVFQNERTTGAKTRGFGAIEDAAAVADGPPKLSIERRAPLREGLNTLRVRVYTKSGVYGQSKALELYRPALGESARPQLHVLAVGANAYGNVFDTLEYARADAMSLASAIADAPPKIYGDIHVETLFDEDVTTDRIVAEIDEMSEVVGPDDSVVIYFAGHGVQTEDDVYRFVTVDVESVDDLVTRALDQDTLMASLGRLQAKNVLLMLDTCHSGAFPAETAGTINNETGLMVLSASSTVQEALDGYDGSNGVFGYALLEALSGEAASRSGVVDAASVGFYVRDRVPELAAEKAHSQVPQFFVRSSNAFPLTEPES